MALPTLILYVLAALGAFLVYRWRYVNVSTHVFDSLLLVDCYRALVTTYSHRRGFLIPPPLVFRRAALGQTQ